jgi:hypothetical protein
LEIESYEENRCTPNRISIVFRSEHRQQAKDGASAQTKRTSQQTTASSASADGRSRHIEACNDSLTVKIANDAASATSDRRRGKAPRPNRTDSFDACGRGQGRKDGHQQSRSVGSGRLSAACDRDLEDSSTVVSGSEQKQHVVSDGVSGRYQKGRKRNPNQRRKPRDGSAADGIAAGPTDGRMDCLPVSSQRKNDGDEEAGSHQSNEVVGDGCAEPGDRSAGGFVGNRKFRTVPRTKPQQARHRRFKSPSMADASPVVVGDQTVGQESIVAAAEAEPDTPDVDDSDKLLEQTATLAGCDEISSDDREMNVTGAAAEFEKVDELVPATSYDSSLDDEDQWEDVEDEEEAESADAFEDSVCEVEVEDHDAVGKPCNGDENTHPQLNAAAGSRADGGTVLK